MEQEMIEETVRQGLSEPIWGPYRNAHFWVLKKNGKYRVINSAMGTNRHTLEAAGILVDVDESSEAFAGLLISSMMDVHSGYNQKMLNENSWDYMAFRTMQGLYRPTRQV